MYKDHFTKLLLIKIFVRHPATLVGKNVLISGNQFVLTFPIGHGGGQIVVCY